MSPNILAGRHAGTQAINIYNCLPSAALETPPTSFSNPPQERKKKFNLKTTATHSLICAPHRSQRSHPNNRFKVSSPISLTVAHHLLTKKGWAFVKGLGLADCKGNQSSPLLTAIQPIWFVAAAKKPPPFKTPVWIF